MADTTPQKTYSLEQFVLIGEDSILTYNNLSLREIVDNIAFPLYNVIDDYMNELVSISREVTLDEDQKFKFKYRPKLLCEYLYGNGELYYIILLINGICNMKEFTLTSPILLPPRDKLLNLLKQIYKSEKSQIDMYNENREDS